MLWFNFIFDLIFIVFCFKLITGAPNEDIVQNHLT